MMSGADFSSLQVSFCHDKTSHQQAYEQFFNCPVSFNQATNEMVFSRADTEQSQMLANPALINTLEQWIAEYLEQYNQDSLNTCEGELSSQVQSYILENILLGDIDINVIADSMNLGVRTDIDQSKVKKSDLI